MQGVCVAVAVFPSAAREFLLCRRRCPWKQHLKLERERDELTDGCADVSHTLFTDSEEKLLQSSAASFVCFCRPALQIYALLQSKTNGVLKWQ